MKIIFFGSDEFASVNLEELLATEHKVVACVAPLDRAKGRGLKLTACPVKIAAQKKYIPVLQPANLNDVTFQNALIQYQADVFVVIAYGKILPAAALHIPRLCAINVHASLLPKYRGAAPINSAIMNGEKETGVSVIWMNPTMDAGDILWQETMKIEDDDTSISLRKKMTELGVVGLKNALSALVDGAYALKAQDETQVSFAPKLSKELGRIKWENSAQEIHNKVRGLLPWPTAYTMYQGKQLKILETELVQEPVAISSFNLPSEVVSVGKTGFVLLTGDGQLLIKKVHLESANAMDARSFMVGHRLEIGMRFS